MVVEYSKAQTYILEYIVYLTAPLSVIGSALIMYVILIIERKSLVTSVYHRLMLGMSSLDLVNSLSFLVFGPWALPAEVDYTRNARGNFTTCTVSGFFLNLLFGTLFYSATLALYFLLKIRYGTKEKWIARTIEPVGHILAIGQPLTSGILLIAYRAINPLPKLPGWCWFSDYPFGCSDKDDLECTRGDNLPLAVRIVIADVHILGLCFITIVVSMVLIIVKVRDTERRMQRYTGSRDQDYERTKEVARQAILYIASFILTYLPISVFTAVSNTTAASFACGVLVKTLSVMQGFFNSIIFLRNQYRALTAQGQSLYFLRRLPDLASGPDRSLHLSTAENALSDKADAIERSGPHAGSNSIACQGRRRFRGGFICCAKKLTNFDRPNILINEECRGFHSNNQPLKIRSLVVQGDRSEDR